MPDGKTIALTGATGFVGRFLVNDLMRRGHRVRVLLRKPVDVPLSPDSAVIGDLIRPQNMAEALKGVDAVVHSAGLAHAMSGLPEDDYRAINTDATAALAASALKAGVKRFVFLSSIRAQTGPTATGILDETLAAVPTDAYGRSKLAAEQALEASGIDWVALRPVLVYGPGVKGNMATLVKLAQKNWPLPFGSLQARRSLLAVENLANAIDFVLNYPAPLNRPLIVADDGALTTGDMISALRAGLDRNPGLIPVPGALLRAGFALIGKSEIFGRLAGSLQVSNAALKALGWQPLLATKPALAALSRQSSGA